MGVDKEVVSNKNLYLQVLRGISIASVVLIHCLGKDGVGSWLIKPWLYFSVMLFVFLSGYLTNENKVEGQVFKFYFKRLSKIIPPYILWTVIYLIYDNNLTITYFVKCLVTSKACGVLYFLVDYGQLVVLTPLLFLMLKKKWGRIFLYSITPIYMVLNYVMQWQNWSTVVPLCFWLLLPYLLGLEHKRWEEKVKKIKLGTSIILVLLSVAIETAEGLLWHDFGIVGLMNTQDKLSTLLYFLSVLIFLFRISDAQKEKISKIKLLVKIGDWSFGIFLCHKLFIYIISSFIPLGFPSGLLLWALSFLASIIVVALLNMILPKKISAIIGFV